VVLQSGDDFSYTADDLCAIVRDIKGVKPELAVTLSVGERPLDNYRALRDAGADRFLLKHETINPELYRKLHPGQESSERLKRLEELRRLGYQVGTGFIVGLPGQTFEDLADEIEFMRSFQPDMAGVGPFMPQCETPLASVPPGDTELALKCVALTRIVTGNAHLPATTALGSSDPENGYRRALRAGCNVLMFDGTPEAYREAYRIYDNKVQTDCERAVALIDEAGLVPSRERGDSLKETRRTGSPAGG
jgi:biotin synthase